MRRTKNMAIFGGIEAGGTKFVCAVGTGPDDIRSEESFPTTTPDETLAKAIEFFRKFQEEKPLTALGIGSFGPLDPMVSSPNFGYITSTPKPHWVQTNIAGIIRRALGTPVGFDTDVNAAALGEHTWGAAKGLDSFIYLTVGTGIGGGGMCNGKLMHGMLHPEMGHIRIPHDREKDPFEGICPYHGDCFEGLAAGPAVGKRWGTPANDLPENHEAWELESHYLAMGLANYIFILSPQRIILGGGVMKKRFLFPMIREKVRTILNGYIRTQEIMEDIDSYIVPPALEDRAGVAGAIALARKAAGDKF
jgi:fructokinase